MAKNHQDTRGFTNPTFTRNPLFLSVSAAALLLCGQQTLANNGALVLEEVVVTAQKRSENIQDIAATVNAVGGDAIDDFVITQFDDVAKLTAGLSMNRQSSAASSEVSLRGITYNRQSGTNPAVDVYWNDVNYRATSMFNSMFDVERIEVLRGPQGTLQGKTSPAGAIKLVTRKPSFEAVEGQVQATMDDADSSNVQFGVSIPISETLAIRVAGVTETSELNQVKSFTSGESDDYDAEGGRLTVAWQPSDTFSATLSAEYFESETRTLEELSGSANTSFFGAYFPSGVDASGYPSLDAEDLKALSDGSNHNTMRQNIASMELVWEVGGHELTSLTGYWDAGWSETRDMDLANFVPDTVQNRNNDNQVYTTIQEFRIGSTEPNWWEYLGGVYYQKTNSLTTFEADTYPNNGAVSLLQTIPISTEEYGVFTHNRIELSEASELQVGLRWIRSRRSVAADQFYGNGWDCAGVIDMQPGFSLPCFLGGARGEALNPILGNFNSQLVQQFIPEDRQFDSEDAFTGGVKYIYNASEDLMMYASLDRSWRPGGMGISPEVSDPDTLLYNSETSDSIEIGFKSSLMDGRIQLNGAVFYQEFDGFIGFATEVPVDSDGNGAPDAASANFAYNADATSFGAEVEMTGLVTEFWKMGASLSYVDFKYDEGEVGPCNDSAQFVGNSPGGANNVVVAECEIDGERVGVEPNWQLNVHSEYFVPLESVDWFMRGLYNYRSGSENRFVDDSDVKGYGTLDLYSGIRSKDNAWEVSLWAKNLTDEQAQTRIYAEETRQGVLPTGYHAVDSIKGRSVGATLRYNFSM
ncbi:MAG: TonB-dependent receptor [Cellvibrionaceae bacterium]